MVTTYNLIQIMLTILEAYFHKINLEKTSQQAKFKQVSNQKICVKKVLMSTIIFIVFFE